MIDTLARYGLPADEALREAHVAWLMRSEIPSGNDPHFVAWKDPAEPWRPQTGRGTRECMLRLVRDELTDIERRRFRDVAKDLAFAESAAQIRVERLIAQALRNAA